MTVNDFIIDTLGTRINYEWFDCLWIAMFIAMITHLGTILCYGHVDSKEIPKDNKKWFFISILFALCINSYLLYNFKMGAPDGRKIKKLYYQAIHEWKKSEQRCVTQLEVQQEKLIN